jgi:hypothetical protein
MNDVRLEWIAQSDLQVTTDLFASFEDEHGRVPKKKNGMANFKHSMTDGVCRRWIFCRQGSESQDEPGPAEMSNAWATVPGWSEEKHLLEASGSGLSYLLFRKRVRVGGSGQRHHDITVPEGRESGAHGSFSVQTRRNDEKDSVRWAVEFSDTPVLRKKRLKIYEGCPLNFAFGARKPRTPHCSNPAFASQFGCVQPL